MIHEGARTWWDRAREVAVLKALGAKRDHIAAVFSVEFIVLWVVGVIFANLLSRVLLRRLDVALRVA